MNRKGYRFFAHTADIGIRAQGRTLQQLFIRMAQGLVELLAEDSRLERCHARQITLSQDGVESLLLAWMQELLFWFSTDRFLPVVYRLKSVTPTALRGEVVGDFFEPSRHVQGHEVKAITRHSFHVSKRHGIWHAKVIVDI